MERNAGRTDFLSGLDWDGFAIVTEALDPAAVSDLAAAIDRALAGPAALNRSGAGYALRDLLRRIPEVRALAGSEAVRALIGPVLGPGAVAVRGLLFDKTPGANWKVPWHRDLTIAVRQRVDTPGYGPWTVKEGVVHVRPPLTVLDRMLTVRFHLDDCGPENGPLLVLPGSHREADFDEGSVARWRDRVSAVSCPVARGGALLMRPLLLHASSVSAAPGRRRVIHLEFAAEPLPGGVEWFETGE